MIRVMLACLVFVAGAHSEGFAPVEPSRVLDQKLSAVEKLKGKGEYNYGVSAEGKSLSDVDYSETWFGLPDKVKAQYIVLSDKDSDPKIMQITLGFKDEVKRDAIIKAASGFLGKAEEGKSGEGAPSEYYAHWVKDGVGYDLQDFGDYRELYISWARFSYAEKYKLKEPVYIVAEQVGKVSAKGREKKVMLLAVFDEAKGGIAQWPEYSKVWLYVCAPDKEEKGTLVELPDAMQHQSLAAFQMSESGDEKAAVVTVTWTERSSKDQKKSTVAIEVGVKK